MKWIIIDKRISEKAKEKLSRFGQLLEFESKGIVYDGISGHPDIFFCKCGGKLVVAPNTPVSFIKTLQDNNISFVFGENYLNVKHPDTVYYNAVISSKYLIHNLKYTDSKIIELCSEKIQINLSQAYTRCNLFNVGNDFFITSDRDIEKTLIKQNLQVKFVNPSGIILPGFRNGFFGGCCGLDNNRIFVNGSLNLLKNSKKIIDFIYDAGLEIIELHEGMLFDGGGILFIDT